MRFLADMGISPRSVVYLNDLGHDAVHLHDEDLDRLSDADILAKAQNQGRVVITHDLDFGDLIAASKTHLPSVIILRLRNMSADRVNPLSGNRHFQLSGTSQHWGNYQCHRKAYPGACIAD